MQKVSEVSGTLQCYQI